MTAELAVIALDDPVVVASGDHQGDVGAVHHTFVEVDVLSSSELDDADAEDGAGDKVEDGTAEDVSEGADEDGSTEEDSEGTADVSEGTEVEDTPEEADDGASVPEGIWEVIVPVGSGIVEESQSVSSASGISVTQTTLVVVRGTTTVVVAVIGIPRSSRSTSSERFPLGLLRCGE